MPTPETKNGHTILEQDEFSLRCSQQALHVYPYALRMTFYFTYIYEQFLTISTLFNLILWLSLNLDLDILK